MCARCPSVQMRPVQGCAWGTFHQDEPALGSHVHGALCPGKAEVLRGRHSSQERPCGGRLPFAVRAVRSVRCLQWAISSGLFLDVAQRSW